MDRRRFLLGSAVGASLLAGCTQEELSQARRMADDVGKNGEASPNGDESGGNMSDGSTGSTGSDDKHGTDDIGVSEGAGLLTTESDDDFDATVERITATIEGNDALTLVTTVDHAANAESVGLELPPTTLFIFGNPMLGTPLMQASRSVAIDLPQKMLVWEEDERVMVTYNDPQYLAARHGIDDEDEILEKIAGALGTIATGMSG